MSFFFFFFPVHFPSQKTRSAEDGISGISQAFTSGRRKQRLQWEEDLQCAVSLCIGAKLILFFSLFLFLHQRSLLTLLPLKGLVAYSLTSVRLQCKETDTIAHSRPISDSCLCNPKSQSLRCLSIQIQQFAQTLSAWVIAGSKWFPFHVR